MYKNTKDKMIAYAQMLKPSVERAQAYHIANLEVITTIADALENDHRSQDGARRAALLMCDAGCAIEDKTLSKKYEFGVFTFEDGSKL